MKNKSRNIDYLIFILAFVIPVVIIAIAYYSKGVYPKGTNTVLTMDMGAQYMPFWASLRYLGKSDNSLFFNISGALGNNFYGFAYYIFSPFSWITVLFSLERLPDVIYFLTLFKIGLCGFGFGFFLSYTYQEKKHKVAIFLLSCCYALMSYNVGYSINLMWLDVVLLLPWILVGIERIIRGKGPLVFILFVFFSLICNYYISFMAAVFAIGYLFIRLFEERKLTIKRVLTFVLYASVGIGMAMPVLLPGYLALVNGKINEDAKVMTSVFRYNLINVFGQLLSGKYDTLMDDGLPMIFCGTGTVILVALYFIKGKDSYRIKIAWLAFIAFYIFSMCFIPLDRVMHGFLETTCFEVRYSFVFSCLLLILAYRGVDSISDRLSTYSIYGFLKCIIIFFVIGELYFNSSILLSGIMDEFGYGPRTDYEMALSSKRDLLDSLDDNGFYRVSDYMPYSYNDGAWLGYNGFGYFSSCYNLKMMSLLGSLGEDQSHHIILDGVRTPLEESLFGAKYRIAENDWPEMGRSILSKEGYEIYENDSALSVGYMVNVNEDMPLSSFSKNAFDNQNSIAKELSGVDQNIFEELDVIDYEEVKSEGFSKASTFTVETVKDAPVWIYFEKPDEIITYNDDKTNRLLVNGYDMGEFINPASDSTYMIFLGRYSKGEKINIEVYSNVYYENCHVDYMNEEAYNRVIDDWKQGQLNIQQHSSGHFKGVIDAGNGGNMFLSLPYIDGWKVRVDGKKVDYVDYRDAFMLIPLTAGEHDIDIAFLSPGFYIGILVGGLSIIVFIGIMYSFFKRTK